MSMLENKFEKKCLEDKDFRIELINFPIKEVKENKILNEWKKI